MSKDEKDELIKDLFRMTNGSPFMKDWEFAILLSIKYDSFKNKVCRGDPLPKPIRIPKLRQRRWLIREVVDWFAKYCSD